MRVALVWHRDRETRDTVRLEEHRLGPTAEALRQEGFSPEAAVYNDDFVDEVREQLLQVDAVLVWVNPIEQGRGREVLDAMLKEVADAGVLVSAHPDTIQRMGTKQVLFETRNMGWGSDVHVYRTLAELQGQLPARLEQGHPRVLKQHRGHSGHGVWKVTPHPSDPTRVYARHAARGSVEQEMALTELYGQLEGYFASGPMFDQAYQERLAEGTIRCYLVQDRVAGFGHQEINALFPGDLQPGPRLYYPPDQPEFQRIKQLMEYEWLPQLLGTLGLSLDDLPILWDADFMFGPKTAEGEDTYVLCEINVSSVYPYPESAMTPLAQALKRRMLRPSGKA